MLPVTGIEARPGPPETYRNYSSGLLVQCNLFIILNLVSIGMGSVISEPCYKGTIYKGIIGK